MTIKECIDIVDNIKPNQYSIKDKVMWLSFLDETIINDVLKTHEGYDGRYDDFTGYTEDKLSVSLIVPSPYDRVYTAYLKMQIDKENGETARYNNSMALYNTYLLEYRKHYNKTHMPLSHDARPGRGVSVKVDVNLTEAEFEAIKRDVYNQLSEDMDEVISPDKLYDIVMSYVLNNTEMLKGADGYTPKKGTDYFTEAEVTQIKKDAKGDDGYSPLVEIIPIEGGTRVSITDKNGRKFFDILNGADGKTVSNIDQLEGADQYLKKQGGRASVDYGEEGIDVNVNAQRSVTLGAEHVNIISDYETTFKANKGEVAADFGNQRITNVADPESEKDGVNKKYVDEVFEKIGGFEASVPTRTSDLVNDSGFMTISDVPEAPTKVSQLVNDKGFITLADIPPSGGGGTSGNVPTKLSELEADSISRSDQEPFDFSVYSADFNAHEMNFGVDNLTFRNMGYGSGVSFDGQPLHDVGAPTSDNDAANKKFVDNKETAHDTSSTAHNDIRQLISGLTSRLNAVANSDDTTLDQLSEIVAYIKANKSLIDSITTSKVNVSDIIDNLTTSVSSKPLSAKMGVELKKLIDAIKIPTTLPASDVYSWAKQPTKPTYTAAEVGAATPAYVDEKIGESIEYTLTEADKAEIINAVIEYFGAMPIVGVVDDENNIILNGKLPNGDYSLRYEGANGAYSDVVTLTITDEDKVSYINVLPLAQEYASTSPYVGTDGSAGYGNGMRISTSSPTTTYMKVQTGVDVTALIPVKRGDVLRFKNCNFKVAPSNTSYGTFIQGFNSTKAVISGFNIISTTIEKRIPYVTDGDEIVEITLEPKSEWTESNIDDVAYIMIATDGLDETSIITINQEIID